MDLNNKLLTLDINSSQLYEIFLFEIQEKIDEGHNKEVLKKVKEGISLEFPFEDLVKDRWDKKTYVKTKNGKEIGEDIVKIKIANKEIPEKEFEDELTQRVRLMRGWLWKNMSVEKVGELRSPGGESEE